MTPGKVYERTKFQKYCLKVFILVKFENERKNIMKSANFFVFVLYCSKRRCSQIKLQIKVEIENGKPSI